MIFPKIIPIILSGGVGSRLWPLSRESHPKPFIKLSDGESLIQKTYIRASKIANNNEIITVTNRELFFYTKDEFDEVNYNNIHNTFLLEPVGRNSTSAIALASLYASETYGKDSVLVILPSDHLIKNLEEFKLSVDKASKLALDSKLVTFGITPSSPKTEFGYIEASGNNVIRFVEKPDDETAKKYFENENFFWNSGMFCMTACSFNKELKELCPDIYSQVSISFNSASKSKAHSYIHYDIHKSDFEQIRNISVDYSIFEKSKNVAIVPCDIGWSDVGSWTEFGSLYETDENNNHIFGRTLIKDSTNCIIHGNEKLIATIGLNDIVIANTSDALLVSHKNKVQDVKTIVNELKSSNESCYKEFPTVHRPWGNYTVLLESENFKIKRIEVNSNSKLSLQSHKHRNEHWVVVSGKAIVTNGDKVIELEQNQSTYIPVNNKHRLENANSNTLIMIEVQCGTYLGEDDIVRYDDVYNRS